MDPKRRKNFSLILLNNGFYFMNNFLKRKRQRKRQSCWVKEWLNRCNSLSAYQTILSELRLSDAEYFRRYLSMNTEVYEVERFLQSYYHYQYYYYCCYYYYYYYYYYYLCCIYVCKLMFVAWVITLVKSTRLLLRDPLFPSPGCLAPKYQSQNYCCSQ